MSSRHEKEKRLRPKSNPYKRDHFIQADYLRVVKPLNDHKDTQPKEVLPEAEFEEYYQDDE